MYKIGEFSKISNMSVKTLRYYDEEGILSPSYRDELTGYRYYDDADFQKAQHIQILRTLNFSIQELKDVVEACSTMEEISYYLAEKKTMIAQEIKQKEALIAQIEAYELPNAQQWKQSAYQIDEIDVPEQLFASVRYRGRYDDTGIYIAKLYKEVKGIGSGKPSFNLYYDQEYHEEADIEVCVPLKKRFIPKEVSIREQNGFHGLTLMHGGSYPSLSYAYKAILDYAQEHNIILAWPSMEIYHKGPGKIFKGNPNSYLTQIIVPIQRSE